MQNKIVIPGKVDRLSDRKFRIDKDGASEAAVEIEIAEDGNYEVQKLSLEGLPTRMPDGTLIRWFNNFAIKKDGQYINQLYFVTIAGLSSSRVVIFDGNEKLYYYEGTIKGDTIELTEGDPGIGGAP